MEISPREPNILIHLANALRSAQEFGNKAQIPYLGGAGDLLMGDAQDAAERMSYGESLLSGSGQTTQLHPGTVDLAGLASIPAAMGKSAISKIPGKVSVDPLLKVRTDRGVRPSQAQLSNALRHDDVLARGRIASPQREAYRQAQPRPHRRPVESTQPTGLRAMDYPSQEELIGARMRALDEGGGYAGGRPSPKPVQVDPGRRDFLKMMGVGAAGAGAAAVAPKMLATALKAAPKAAATVAKGTAPAVAKGALKAVTKQAASKHIVMDIMSSYFDNFAISRLTKKQLSKVLDENPEISAGIEKDLAEWGTYNLDEATEGIGQRVSMVVPENVTDMTGLVKGTKAQADEAAELLHSLEPEVFIKWKVTGKWPKKHKDTLKHLDMEDFSEGNYDMPTTEKLFYDLHDDVKSLKRDGASSKALKEAAETMERNKGRTNIVPPKYLE